MNEPYSVFRILASRFLTVAFMALAAVAMIVITIFEAVEDTGETPYILYHSWWFTLLLVLAWLNLILNAVKPAWWKRKRIPSTLSHLGFLLILTGGFITWTIGIDGSLPISEGETRDTFDVKESVLHVTFDDEKGRLHYAFPIRPGPALGTGTLLNALNPFATTSVELEKGPVISMVDSLPSSRIRTDVEESGSGPPAVVLDIDGTARERIVLQDRDRIAVDDRSGLAILYRHIEETEDKDDLLKAVFEEWIAVIPPEGEPVTIPVTFPNDEGKEFSEGGYTIKALEYHPDFKMGRKPSPNDPPNNPALRLDVSGPGGAKVIYTFSKLEFHGNRLDDGTEVKYHRPGSAESLLILSSGTGDCEAWTGKESGPFPLSADEPLPFGPEDKRVRLEAFLPSSKAVEKIEPDPEGRGAPAWRIQAGQENEAVWLIEGREKALSRDGRVRARVEKTMPLGFSLTLDDAVAEFWPASSIPKAYYSHVRIADPGEEAIDSARIETNAPLLHMGFRLYQSGMDQTEPYRYSVFSVARDPGLPLVTAGFLLMMFGLLWFFLVRFVLKPLRAGKGTPLLLAAALTLFSGGSAFAGDEVVVETDETIDLSEMKKILVVSQGRMKPLDTHARETIQRIFEKPRIEGTAGLGEALETYVDLLWKPQAWLDKKCLVPGRELAAEVFEGRMELSPNEVFTARPKLISIVETARRMESAHAAGGAAALEEYEELSSQVMHLFDKAVGTQRLQNGLRIMPDPEKGGGNWLTIDEAQSALEGIPEGDSLRSGIDAYYALKMSWLEGDREAFETALQSLKEAQKIHSAETLSDTLIDVELLYFAVDVKKTGLVLFSLCGLFFILFAFLKTPALKQGALFLLVAGILWNCWIIGGRTAIAGRLPLKNLNEVFLVVLFFVPVIGLFLGALLKNHLYSGLAVILTVIGFTGSLFLDPEGYVITPLVAILHSPWRQVHILTIMLSYAILLVAFGLDAAFLVTGGFRGRAGAGGKIAYNPVAEDLSRKAYFMVAWGFLFLTIGIATGAAWGHSSWGRYWGWDPKEVWATVAWAIYALFLHLRLFFRTRRELLAVINIIGYAAIMFTYFGVTYLLPGLHAYS